MISSATSTFPSLSATWTAVSSSTKTSLHRMKQISNKIFIFVSHCFNTIYNKLMGRLSKQKLVSKEKKATFERMYKNLVRSCVEHGKNINLLPSLPFDSEPIQLKYQVKQSQGTKKAGYREKEKVLEDDYLIEDTDEYSLIGVFDGHGDQGKVANFLKEQFSFVFIKNLQNHLENIPLAFELSFAGLQHMFTKKYEADHQLGGGSTAVVVYVDKTAGIAYTATLGDTEVKKYTKVEEEVHAIPLSRVRNWAWPKEKKRAITARPDLEKQWAKIKDPKRLRYPRNDIGINVSRAIGDIEFGDAISKKCKVTACPLYKGDLLLVGSDGLWDYLKDDIVTSHWDNLELVSTLVDHARRSKGNHDDITLIAANIEAL